MDIRILYIMVMGMMHGVGQSALAAGICCAGLIFVTVSQGGPVYWIVLIERCILYIYLSLVSGYCRTDSKIELKILKESYARLSVLYRKLKENHILLNAEAEALSQQVKTAECSFGKLYRIIKGLEGLTLQELLNQMPRLVYELTGVSGAKFFQVNEQEGEDVSRFLELASKEAYFNFNRLEGLPDVILQVRNNETEEAFGAITIDTIPIETMAASKEHQLRFAGEFLSDFVTKACSRESLNYGDETPYCLKKTDDEVKISSADIDGSPDLDSKAEG